MHIVHDLASFMASLNCWCYSLGWVILCSFGATETAVHTIPVEILVSSWPIERIGRVSEDTKVCTYEEPYIIILRYNHSAVFSNKLQEQLQLIIESLRSRMFLTNLSLGKCQANFTHSWIYGIETNQNTVQTMDYKSYRQFQMRSCESGQVPCYRVQVTYYLFQMPL